MDYESIYVGPAGVKAFAYLGSVLYLNKYIDIFNLKRYIGSSSGAIIVFLISLDLPLKKIIDIILNLELKLNQGSEHNILLNFYNKKGLFSSKFIIDLLKNLIKEFNINPNIKFKDLKKDINILASDITNKKLFVFNKKNTPNALIIDHAIKSSISIPLFFEPVIYKEMLLIDGGYLNMLNINLINKKTLCLKTTGDIIKDNITSEYNLKNYILLLLNSTFHGEEQFNYYDTIEFDIKMLCTNFDLSLQDKKDIYNLGIETTIIFCNKMILLNKYFNLLKNYSLSVAVSN